MFQKQDNRDASIHKRLSWNQQPQPCIPGNDLQLRTKQSKCLSSDSVQSSSGVSSSGSLHLSIGSKFETSAAPPTTPVTDTSPRDPRDPRGGDLVTVGGLSVPASPRLLTKSHSSEAPPVPPRGQHNQHISTTYITQDTTSMVVKQKQPLVVRDRNCQAEKTDRHVKLEREGSGNSLLEAPNPEITINVPESKEPISSINISISNQKSTKTEILKLREILLTDSSVEAS